MDADTRLNRSFETRGWTLPADLGNCVNGLANALARGMAQIVAAHGLTQIDFALLRLFLEVEEWTTIMLAQALPLAPSTISRTAAKLVDKGLVQRRRLLSDGRIVILTLTEEGKALTQDLHGRVQAYDARITVGIGKEEVAAFASTAAKIMDNHAAMEGP